RQPTTYDGVARTGILRTEEMIAASFGRLEPHRVVVAGNDVHFYAESRDGNVVNHVLAGQNQANVSIHRHMKLVDFAPPIGLLKLPHPLLANHIYVQR